MMRLSEPDIDFNAVLTECIRGITGNNPLRAKVEAGKAVLVAAGAAYVQSGASGALHGIPALDTTIEKDPVVIGTLIKSELVNLYDYYFRNEKKDARILYDKLLNSAREECPFCGGIGTPRNLDHFLPKAHFPQFSTLPQNLVPSCRDCNMDGKAESFATREEDQVIQPYLDNERFFSTQWIFGRCIVDATNRPISIHYQVVPPNDWEPVHKARVQKHFDDFELARRFSLKAAQRLPTTLAQIAALKNLDMPNATIRSVILEPGITNAPFANHWQLGLYQALREFLP